MDPEWKTIVEEVIIDVTADPVHIYNSMKYGILDFRYDIFSHFRDEHRRCGSYTINLGDYVQSVAVCSLFRVLGVAEAEMLFVNRDTLRSYRGEPVSIVMNASFDRACFPIPSVINPIFVGFQTFSELLIKENAHYLKKHEPIGCRDLATTRMVLKYNIKAYTTGCLSLTLPARKTTPSRAIVALSSGSGAGAFPEGLMKHIPPSILTLAKEVSQRVRVDTFPLNDEIVSLMMLKAEELLTMYREEISLVITPLLHAASPCLAMGIPTILARADCDTRFGAVSKITPFYRPPQFPKIDWNPKPVAFIELKQRLIRLVADIAAARPPSQDDVTFCNAYFGTPVSG